MFFLPSLTSHPLIKIDNLKQCVILKKELILKKYLSGVFMNKLHYLLCTALLASASNSFTNNEESQELPQKEVQTQSLSRKMLKASAAYAAVGGIFRGIGHVLHGISHAPDYAFKNINLKDIAAFNILEYPKNYYNHSMFKYYCSKVAHGSLTLSSLALSPFRSAFASAIAPIELARNYLRISHALKNPNCGAPNTYMNELNTIKTTGIKQLVKSPIPAIVAFTPIAAYHKIQEYKNKQQN